MKGERHPCSRPGCRESGSHTCEICDRRFCDDHGSKGGDREGGSNPNGSPYGAYAVPACCWNCGGFDADEGQPSPAQYLPGEDPDAICQCPACLRIRRESEAS